MRAARNATVGRTIVVDARGRTLYRLSGENSHRLRCTGSCVATWRPLTVHSRHTKLVAGKGVQGRLGMIRRPGGELQVTLRGEPLYRYAGDHSRGQVRGDGVRSYGGRWEVVLARAPKRPPNPPPI